MPSGSFAMFWPVLALVLLTFGVAVRMLVVRIGEMRRLRIHPQKVAVSAQAAQHFVDTRAADNYRNLFEMPVLFYALAILTFVTAGGSSLLLMLAWLYVALRVAHSVIHCSYNRVMHRFAAFISSALVLLAMWGVLACTLLQRAP